MSDITYYADGDSCTFKLLTRDLDGNMVDVDTASVSVRKCNSTAERDWVLATEVLAASGMSNFDTGVYRYNWSTSSQHAGRYVCEATITRGAVTNKERILILLR